MKQKEDPFSRKFPFLLVKCLIDIQKITGKKLSTARFQLSNLGHLSFTDIDPHPYYAQVQL